MKLIYAEDLLENFPKGEAFTSEYIIDKINKSKAIILKDVIYKDDALDALGARPNNYTNEPEEIQEVWDWDYYYHSIKTIEPIKFPNPCQNCSNNPQNGGSGICHCILGSPKIT